MGGPKGLTTEMFVEGVAKDLASMMETEGLPEPYVHKVEKKQEVVARMQRASWSKKVDEEAMKAFFDKFDTDGNGMICFEEFAAMSVELGIAPLKPEALKAKESNPVKQQA